MSEDNKAVIRRLVAEDLNASASSTAPLGGPCLAIWPTVLLAR